MNSKTMTDMPLGGQRNFAYLARLSPGVLPAEPGARDGANGGLSGGGVRGNGQNNFDFSGNIDEVRIYNRALPEARGRYVLFLNPDCIVGPSVIARLRAVLDERPDVGLGGCLILNPDGTEQTSGRRRTPTPGVALLYAFGFARSRLGRRLFGRRSAEMRPLPTEPVEVEAISGAFMFARRADIDQVGMLDEGYFLHCEDLDWCMRFRQRGKRILFVPDVSAIHYKGESSRRRPVHSLWHMHRGMIRYYRKFFRESYSTPLFWLVLTGVALRFVVLGTVAAVRRGGVRA